jgi:hypothetical protein
MASTSQSGYGSKLKSSEDLIEYKATLTRWNPIHADLKDPGYTNFVTGVRTAMTPFNTAEGKFKTCENETQVIQDLVIATTRKVRGALFEIYLESETYQDYNHTIDLITGDNVVKNYYKRKAEEEKEKVPAAPVEPLPQPKDFQSVSQQDRGSIYTFFTTLIDELTLDANYLPEEPELQIDGLNDLRETFRLKLKEYAKLEGEYKVQEAIIQPLFNGPSSLHERAERAKAHIKRQYGKDSVEYKTVTGKSY